MRHSVSSLNASRSATEPPPRATTTTSTSGRAASPVSARAIARRGAAVLHRGERPHDASRPSRGGADRRARRRGPCRVSPVTTPIDARQRRPGQRLLRLEQSLVGEHASQTLDLGEQVALAGEPERGHGEGERRGRRRGPRVEVAPARHDDPGAVGEAALWQAERVEIRPPHGARQRTAGVAQLEVDPAACRPQAADLAEELDAREARAAGERNPSAYAPTAYGPVPGAPAIAAGRATASSIGRRLPVRPAPVRVCPDRAIATYHRAAPALFPVEAS